MNIHQNSSSFGNWTTSKYHFSVTEATCMKPKVSRKKTEQTLTCSLKCSQISRFFFQPSWNVGIKVIKVYNPNIWTFKHGNFNPFIRKNVARIRGFPAMNGFVKTSFHVVGGERKVIGRSHRIHVWHIYHPTHWIWPQNLAWPCRETRLRGDTFLCERSF